LFSKKNHIDADVELICPQGTFSLLTRKSGSSTDWSLISNCDSFLFLYRKMINLFKIKGQKKEEAASAAGKTPVKKQSAGELRLHKGLLSYRRIFLLPICSLFFFEPSFIYIT
jgi:hypothetical protein